MCGAIPPFPQYAFMAWCSIKKSTGTIHLTLIGHPESHSDLECPDTWSGLLYCHGTARASVIGGVQGAQIG
jgi:hypothetical protein